MNFAESKQILDDLGIQYSLIHEWKDGKSKEIEIYENVMLPLTPEDWCALCMNEPELYTQRQSEYLGGCCGNLSFVQDHINTWFRFGGCVNTKDLMEIAEAIMEHDGDHPDFQIWTEDVLKEIISNFSKITALAKICFVWNLVRKFCNRESPSVKINRKSDFENAVHILGNGIDNLQWLSFIDKTQEKSEIIQVFYRFLPALKTIWETIEQVKPEPIEGWCLFKNDEPCYNRVGYMFSETKEKLQEGLDFLKQNEEKYENRADHMKINFSELSIRKVRISVEKGLEEI